MKTTYYRYTLEGEQPAQEAQRALGGDASQGMIVRIDTVGGQTHVYVARQDVGTKSVATDARKEPTTGTMKVEEVPESEVTKPF